jgi:MFS family permease
MKIERPKLWTKDFLIISCVNFIVGLNFTLLMIIITKYAMSEFNSSPAAAGLASGIFIFGALFARLLSGKLIVNTGAKKILYAGLVMGFVTAFLYFGSRSFILLLIIRFFNGVAFGVTSTAAGAIAANIIPRTRTGEGIGYFGLSVTIASAIGPFLGMFLSQNGSYSTIFIICIIFSAINLVIGLFISIPEMKLTGQQLEGIKGFKLSSFVEVKVIPIAIICMILYFCYSSIMSFLAVYAKEIHLVGPASFFFIIYAAAVFFSRLFVGRLFDSKGENLVMYSAILIFMMGMILFSQARIGYMLLLSAPIIGLGFGSASSSGQAIAVKVTEPHRVGLATSTFFMLGDIGMGTGPFIFGLFVSFLSYRGVYLGAAIIILVCVFLYYILYGKRARQSKMIKSP